MKYFFIALYSFFILSGFLVGQLFLPGMPVNTLIFSTLSMGLLTLYLEKQVSCDYSLRYFFLFLFFFCLMSLITGYIDRFIALFRTFFFIAYIFYWSTKTLIVRYGTISPLVLVLTGIGILDAIVTTCQAFGIVLDYPLIQMLTSNSLQDEIIDSHDGELGFALSGLYLSSVINGHNLLFFFLLSLFIQAKSTNYFGIGASMIIFAGLFFCQQRSPFYIALFCGTVFYLKCAGSSFRGKIWLFVTVVVVILYVFPYYINYVEESGSRIMSQDDTNRFLIMEKCIDFLFENPVITGYHRFVAVKMSYPHNLFFSAFLAGGIFGGIIFMKMLYKQFNFLLHHVLCNSSSRVCFLSFLVYMAIVFDSLFHNTGWVDGDYATFICWSVSYYYVIQCNKDLKYETKYSSYNDE